MVMAAYSFLLALALGVSSPWWLWRIGRYRIGLPERLGRVPDALRAAVAGKRVVWVHAVSVGEVLAVERLIAELRAALGQGWVIAVSTTTATGQKIARERLPSSPVFYFPLDFAFAVRAWLRALQPELMVLVESEFWPRHLLECERAGVRVAVVNARVSDRSFPRYMRLRRLWKPLLAKVTIFLAQGEESAERLRKVGVERVAVVGNLKYDVRLDESPRAKFLGSLLIARKVVIAGSTLEGEEIQVLRCWTQVLKAEPTAFLILAPRHPERFASVASMISEHEYRHTGFRILKSDEVEDFSSVQVLLLDTLGDLASIYQLAAVTFIGGSLVDKGGHNPLEAARFGVPVVMGESYENFREIVNGMRAADAIRIVDAAGLGPALVDLLRDDRGMGERGRRFFAGQSGATQRTVEVLVGLIG
jgi:3-deoxy-D-manno-octulosonic-acid transferase